MTISEELLCSLVRLTAKLCELEASRTITGPASFETSKVGMDLMTEVGRAVEVVKRAEKYAK